MSAFGALAYDLGRDTLANNATNTDRHPMTRSIRAFSLLAILLLTSQGNAEPLEYIGKPIGGIPVSSAVKVGKSLFVSGMMPASDPGGKLWGNFPAQMTSHGRP